MPTAAPTAVPTAAPTPTAVPTTAPTPAPTATAVPTPDAPDDGDHGHGGPSTDRLVTVADEPGNAALRLESLLTPADARLASIVQERIDTAQDFPTRSLTEGFPGGAVKKPLYERGGQLYYDSPRGEQAFDGFASGIVGEVGLTSTFFEPNGEFQFNIKAFKSHEGEMDPIVFPGQSTAGHLHTFFGSTALNGNSTTASLFGAPTTAFPVARNGSEYIGDFSSYWVPTLTVGTTQPEPLQNSIYYSNPNGNYHLINGDKDKSRPPIEEVQPFPLGLRMIAGDGSATTSGAMSNRTHYLVSCPGEAPITIRRGTNISSIQNQPLNGCWVRMFILFPGWWDGVHLSTPDQSHMSYTKTATHQVPVPAITYVIPYRVRTNATIADINLTSAGPLWALHADFWNAWDPTMLEFLIDETINKGENWQEWIAVTEDTAFTREDVTGETGLGLGAANG